MKEQTIRSEMVRRWSLFLCVVVAIVGGTSTCATGQRERLSDSSAQSSGSGDLFDSGVNGPLRIEPENPTMTVSLPLSGKTIQFSCLDSASGMPAEKVQFSLGSSDVGVISMDGVFTPTGQRAGEVAVRCTKDGATAESLLRVRLRVVEIDSGLLPEQIAALRDDTGAQDPLFQFLYPYNETVFPRGIPAPEIHLSAGQMPGDVYYVFIAALNFEYEGFFNQSGATPQLHMSQSAWDVLTASVGGTKVEVRAAKLALDKKYGPITRNWRIAPGTLHGTIYYNTYDSQVANKTGAVMRIKGSASSPSVLLEKCTVCHGVSADGSTLAVANDDGSGGTFDLTAGGQEPTSIWKEPQRAAFAALYPKNGEVLVTSGMPGSYWPPNTPGTGAGPWTSELRMKSGVLIPLSGIETYYAQTPAFSPDGSLLAFTDRTPITPYASVLALLHFDAPSKKFSGYEVLASPPPGEHFSWPAFTPDGHYVVYQHGRSDDLATWKETSPTNEGRIFTIDLKTKKRIYLTQLNGDGAMPAGLRDEAKNFMPTIAPIASGGFFWSMFTSRRTYGNKLTGPESDTKRLWVSAIDINAPDGLDPSHPAFYLPGQELKSGNSRGFWVLDPCKADGKACESGDECCGGRCDPKGEPPVLRCGPPDGTCSDEFEVCAVDDDCCEGVNLVCINGKCAQVQPK